MRLRIDSTSYAEYVSAIIIGNYIWRCRWPGFKPQNPDGTSPQPPVTMVSRLGYTYLGMLAAQNNLPFDEIYTELLNGPLGKDIVDNLKLTPVQKVAYVADRIAVAAVQDPDVADKWFFGKMVIPRIEPYIDLVSAPEVIA